jgi:hypothetical protein
VLYAPSGDIAVADDKDRIIVSRIQHRRGLKQDLPQPLRPGEIGFAVDSRQVYIGGESNHPNSAQYDTVSFFENTLNAQEITQSIVDNQLIAFTVPGYKLSRGEFDGIRTSADWTASTERSIISGAQSPSCVHTSAQVPVFTPLVTDPIDALVTVGSPQTTGAITVTISTLASGIPVTRVQRGDLVFRGSQQISTSSGITEISTTGVPQGQVRITFTATIGLGVVGVGNELEIVSATMFNMFKGTQTNRGRFTSADVTVHKNGVKLIPEANAAIVDRPSPTADYAFNGTSVGGVEPRHTLTLRTPPSSRDEVTLTYYGNAQIATTLEGVNNRVSVSTTFPSFYADQQIPDFLKIPTENIRVSGVTGLGYFALDTRHITAFALSTQDITTPDNLGSTGNLLISRTDSLFDATATTITNPLPLNQPGLITMEFDSGSSPEFESGLQIFTVPTTPTERKDFYRYDHLVIESNNPQDYISSKLYPVKAEFDPQNSISKVQVAVPDLTDAVVARAGLASNTVITGNTVGIVAGDLIDVFFDGGNVSGVVDSVNNNNFVIDQAIPESNVTYVNRGQGSVAGEFQVLIPGQAASLDVDQVIGVALFASDATVTDSGTTTTVTRRGNEFDTIFVADLPPAVDFDADPEQEKSLTVRPRLDPPLGTIKIRPVLSVFLGTTNTLEEIASIVNENRQIEIPAAGILPASQNSTGSVQIFPAFGVQPGTTNRVFVTQRPGYSSVDVGGLEFQLHEDPNTPLLQRLNLVPRTYTRDDTVRAKLEVWLDKFLKDRSTNLFTQVLLGGEKYTSQPVSSLGTYSLVVDRVFGEIIFCDRTEASNFNFLVNNLYASSAFGQRDDTLGGVRGLVNLKNNIEIQTRESASAGEKVVSFQNMEVVRFPRTDQNRAGDTKFTLDITQFNNFVIDYSIADLGAASADADRYQRTGTMYISAIPDDANSATISDVFTSYIKSDDGNQLEPKFQAVVSGDGNSVEIKLAQQDPADFNTAYDIDTELNMRYVVRRWSSFN